MSQKSPLNPDTRTNILRVIACSSEPVSNDSIAYHLGMVKKTVREYTLKLYGEKVIDRMKAVAGRREWKYFIAGGAETRVDQPFAGTDPQKDEVAAAAAA